MRISDLNNSESLVRVNCGTEVSYQPTERKIERKDIADMLQRGPYYGCPGILVQQSPDNMTGWLTLQPEPFSAANGLAGLSLNWIRTMARTAVAQHRHHHHHVLPAGAARKRFLLFYSFPLYSSFPQFGLHLRDLHLSCLQFCQKRRIQGRWKESEWLRSRVSPAAIIAHLMIS